MSKVEIPKPAVMAEIAKKREQDYEKSVLEGPKFREIVQRIESAAFEGKTSIRVSVESFESRQDLSVILKALIEAGYSCKTEANPLLFNLITHYSISWKGAVWNG